ncbi:hypothetical protein C8J57DRAFT_1235884 [Mycena rebaudengoi]|nr:hypothetical protein C8J57DRAFT_1235884 [Mycena rebaudengoi]
MHSEAPIEREAPDTHPPVLSHIHPRVALRSPASSPNTSPLCQALHPIFARPRLKHRMQIERVYTEVRHTAAENIARGRRVFDEADDGYTHGRLAHWRTADAVRETGGRGSIGQWDAMVVFMFVLVLVMMQSYSPAAAAARTPSRAQELVRVL